MTIKQTIISITLIGFIVNNGLAMEENDLAIFTRKLIEEKHPGAFKNPTLKVAEDTKIEKDYTRLSYQKSNFPDSLEGLEDHYQVIICAKKEYKNTKVLINPYPHFNPNILCERSLKKIPEGIYTIGQFRKAHKIFQKIEHDKLLQQ